MNDSSSNNCESTHQPKPEVVMDVNVDAKRPSATSATRSGIIELRIEQTRLRTEQTQWLRDIQKEVNAATERRDDIKMKLTELTARKAKCGCCPLWRSQLISSALEDDLRSAEERLSEAQQKHQKAFDDLVEVEEDDSGLRIPIRKLVQTLSSTTPGATNPWVSTLQAQTKRPKRLREQSAKHYGCYGLRGDGILAKCVVTGIEGGRERVTNAHLLPRNASKHFLKELRMTSVDDQKNMIFLCLEIDKAFELQKLCFIPEEQDQFSTCYRLKIWDESTREKPLFSGATETIGDYESKSFCFPDGKAPYSRVLSLHAQCSYQTAIEKGWIDPRDEPKPENYGTPMDEPSFRDMVQQDSTTIVATEAANSSNHWNSPRASDT